MVKLDRRLAQKIVDQIMPTIGHNVNIINDNGIIIGSGNPRRLGTLHEGAVIVVAAQQGLEVDEVTADRLTGVEAGINLPLWAAGHIVGVLGITGRPEAVRSFGGLSKLTAEVLVEQSQFQPEQRRSRPRADREELALQAIRGDGTPDDLGDLARALGVDLGCPRMVAVVKIGRYGQTAETLQAQLQRVKDVLCPTTGDCLVAAVSLNELVLLKPVFHRKSTTPTDDNRRWADRLLAKLTAALAGAGAGPAGGIRIAAGPCAPNLAAVRYAYQAARMTLRVGGLRDPGQGAYCYDDYKMPVLLSGLADGWQAQSLRGLVDRLAGHDRRGILRRTLAAWFDQNMNMSDTAKALGVHRNTLVYRLTRIREITGLELERLDARFLLYAAMQIIEQPPGLMQP